MMPKGREKMNYLEVARKIQEDNPNLQLYTNKGHDAIGCWSHRAGKVEALMSQLISGGWAQVQGILANGEPVWKQEDWLPMAHEEMNK
jgi:hypothetical protein